MPGRSFAKRSSGKTDATVERLKTRVVADEVVLDSLLHPEHAVLEGIGAALQPLDRRLAIAERGYDSASAVARPQGDVPPALSAYFATVQRLRSRKRQRMGEMYGCSGNSADYVSPPVRMGRMTTPMNASRFSSASLYRFQEECALGAAASATADSAVR